MGVLTSALLLCLQFDFSCRAAAEPSSLKADSVPLSPHVSATAAPESDTPEPKPSGALELNPLPVVYGKFGGNVEIALAPHQALVISPAYYSFGNYFHGPEAELGYRYYFRERTLSGPFVGLGVMGGAFQYHPDSGNCGAGAAGCSTEDQGTFVLGGTFEVGWQWIVRDTLLLGIGAGLAAQYGAPRSRQLYESDFTNIAELVLDSGVRPRVLGTIGVVF
jgi:Protein of unknown function (DUF3575)